MTVLRKVENSTTVTFWCPGCDEAHQIDTAHWEFNNDFEAPTFSPSYLTWVEPNPNALPGDEYKKYREGFRCHSFIRDGYIQFLDDCTHGLKGQTVRLTSDW